jgi:RND superfamily putative drug exporter
MGVILGVAVLLDTLLVRLLLLPAVLRLLGRAAWWTPRLLDRLPQGLRLRHGGLPDPPATQPGAPSTHVSP